jgi:ABC-type Fe3+ transport system substrate-binding protein
LISIGGEGIDAAPQPVEACTPARTEAVRADIRISKIRSSFPVTVATVPMVNTTLVAEGEVPSTRAELADPKWQDRVALAGADKSGSALSRMPQIIHTAGNEDAGWPLFQAMFPDLIETGSAGAVSRGAAAGNTPAA